MQLNTRALFSLIPAVLIAPANVSVPIVPRADGYVITMRVTPGAEAPMTVTFKTAGEKMRVEADMSSVMGGRGGAMAAGAYILPDPAGKIIMVMPNAPNMSGGTGMAMSMDPAGMMAGRGQAPPPVGDVSIEDLGAGESILGHATHKYRVKPANPDDSMDLWLATDIPGLDYKKFASSFGARFTGTDPRMMGKIPNGFVLKAVSKGKNAMTMEVTKIEKASFTDAEFTVPAGIQVMDLGAMMGGRGRGNQ